MNLSGMFFRIRLALLMYGFSWLLRLAGMINGDFARRLAETPFRFVMKTKDGGPLRYYHCIGGKMRSSRKPFSVEDPVDFGLVWHDSRAGGRAMYEMLLGKPKALNRAVEKQVLLLEGDARMIYWFLRTIARLNRVFRPAGKKSSGHQETPDTSEKS